MVDLRRQKRNADLDLLFFSPPSSFLVRNVGKGRPLNVPANPFSFFFSFGSDIDDPHSDMLHLDIW